jgi:hypothetical protein
VEIKGVCLITRVFALITMGQVLALHNKEAPLGQVSFNRPVNVACGCLVKATCKKRTRLVNSSLLTFFLDCHGRSLQVSFIDYKLHALHRSNFVHRLSRRHLRLELNSGDVTHEWIRNRPQCGLLIGRIFYPCGRWLTQDTRRSASGLPIDRQWQWTWPGELRVKPVPKAPCRLKCRLKSAI